MILVKEFIHIKVLKYTILLMEKIDFQAEAYLQESLYTNDLKFLQDRFKLNGLNGQTVCFFYY